jgi:hypothetical protein
MTEARTVVADPALGFSYQVVLDKEARRTLVFQTHVPFDASAEAIDALLDKIGKAADRQIAVYELREAQQFLEDHQRTAKSLLIQQENLDQLAQARYEQSGKRGDWTPEKLPAQEKQQRHNLNVSIERYREGIEKYDKIIGRLAPMVNGHAPDIGANRHAGQPGG